MPGFDFYVVYDTEKTGLPSIDFGAETPVGVSGFYKAVLKWVKCFLTAQGSDPSDSSYGTALADSIGGNISQTSVIDLAHQAVHNTTNTIKAYQANLTDTSERISDAALTSVIYDPGSSSIQVYVTIQNEAGESLVLNLPTGVKTPPPSN